jgi:hypothetical protein
MPLDHEGDALKTLHALRPVLQLAARIGSYWRDETGDPAVGIPYREDDVGTELRSMLDELRDLDPNDGGWSLYLEKKLSLKCCCRKSAICGAPDCDKEDKSE